MKKIVKDWFVDYGTCQCPFCKEEARIDHNYCEKCNATFQIVAVKGHNSDEE